MRKELSPKLLYHDLTHTLRVLDSLRMYIGEEKIDDYHADMLLVAGAYHDAGFLFQYEHNEPRAVELINEVLPQFGFHEQEIDFIGEIILSTRTSVIPKNICEQIMNDADHDYFGTDDYYEIAQKLRAEIANYGEVFSDREWIGKQYDYLLNKHRFYTRTGVYLRRYKKYQIINELIGFMD